VTAINTNFYRTYADHMWRFYIRYMDGNIPNISDPDRANWTACHSVYSRIRPEWQTVVSIYYRCPELNSQSIEDYCSQRSMPMATVWKIIRSVQRMAAEERGLIAERTIRNPLSEVTHYAKQDTKQTDQ